MKKIIALLLLVLSLTSTVLATEKGQMSEAEKVFWKEMVNAYKDSNLPPLRWSYVGSFGNGKDIDRMLFYDTETITTPYPDEMDVWWCFYFTGTGTCNFTSCEKNKTQTAKHYHLNRVKYNFPFVTVGQSISTV